MIQHVSPLARAGKTTAPGILVRAPWTSHWRWVYGLPLMSAVSACSTPLTHSPLDLTPLGTVFGALGMIYWLLAIAALVWAFRAAKDTKGRVIMVALVLALFSILPVRGLISATERRAEAQKALARLQIAEAMFQERCKKAGVFIHRTVDDVDSLFVMKLRSKELNHGEQFKMDDPYGFDGSGEGYLVDFLMGRTARGSLTNKQEEEATPGYRYVEAVDPADGKRYRYTASMKVVGRKDTNATNVQLSLRDNPNYDLNNYAFVLDKSTAPGTPPRYGVTYDDISTREDREYWIAGSSLRVVDLTTNEVIAERIGYMMDRGQGANAAMGSPWLRAEKHACPAFPTDPGGQPYRFNQTRDFVEKVLKIRKGH